MKPTHSITNPDIEGRTGTCAICGDTTIYRVTAPSCALGYYWTCAYQNAKKNNRRKAKPSSQSYLYEYDDGALRLSVKQRQAIIDQYNSVCAICGTYTAKPCIDHCHTTGRIRGVLCPAHNSGLGYFKDSTMDMRAAIAYLEQHERTHVYVVDRVKEQ